MHSEQELYSQAYVVLQSIDQQIEIEKKRAEELDIPFLLMQDRSGNSVIGGLLATKAMCLNTMTLLKAADIHRKSNDSLLLEMKRRR